MTETKKSVSKGNEPKKRAGPSVKSLFMPVSIGFSSLAVVVSCVAIVLGGYGLHQVVTLKSQVKQVGASQVSEVLKWQNQQAVLKSNQIQMKQQQESNHQSSSQQLASLQKEMVHMQQQQRQVSDHMQATLAGLHQQQWHDTRQTVKKWLQQVRLQLLQGQLTLFWNRLLAERSFDPASWTHIKSNFKDELSSQPQLAAAMTEFHQQLLRMPHDPVESVVVALGKVNHQLSQLSFKRVIATPRAKLDQSSGDFKTRVDNLWSQIKSLVVISHNQKLNPMVLKDQYRAQVVEQLQLLVTQSQLALMQHQVPIFHQALLEARHLIQTYAEGKEAQNLQQTIAQLAKQVKSFDMQPLTQAYDKLREGLASQYTDNQVVLGQQA